MALKNSSNAKHFTLYILYRSDLTNKRQIMRVDFLKHEIQYKNYTFIRNKLRIDHVTLVATH